MEIENNPLIIKDELAFDVADFFKILGDSTRIRIMYALSAGELNVSNISTLLNMSQSAVSHQLRVLRQNGLVKNRKSGKTVFYLLDDDHVSNLLTQGIAHIEHKHGY